MKPGLSTVPQKMTPEKLANLRKKQEGTFCTLLCGNGENAGVKGSVRTGSLLVLAEENILPEDTTLVQ